MHTEDAESGNNKTTDLESNDQGNFIIKNIFFSI